MKLNNADLGLTAQRNDSGDGMTTELAMVTLSNVEGLYPRRPPLAEAGKGGAFGSTFWRQKVVKVKMTKQIEDKTLK